MKKIILALFGILITSPVFATTVVTSPYISGNDVTISALNNNQNAIVNTINGGIEGGGINIKAGSITSMDQATSISIVQFRKEAFNNWTYSGMLPATSASLTTTTSAGVSYMNGVRIQTSDTAHAYTASKDTYLYINSGGFFDYVEVSNGAAAPSTPANDLLLAKVVSSGSAITGVTDLRTLSIQITVNGSNFPADYRNQALVVRDSSSAMHMEPGVFSIGTSLYTNLADTSSRAISTSSNWIEGTVPNPNNLHFYVYAYNNSGTAYDFKYASADPVYSDTSLNTGGTLQYYTNGGTTYRTMAWVSCDSSGNIQTWNYANYPSSTNKNYNYYSTGAVATGTTAVPNDDTIPQITEGDEYMNIPFRAANANDRITIRAIAYVSYSGGTIIETMSLFKNQGANAIAVATGHIDSSSGAHAFPITMNYSAIVGDTNLNVYRIRIGNSTGATTTFNGESGSRIMGGALISSLSVEESSS